MELMISDTTIDDFPTTVKGFLFGFHGTLQSVRVSNLAVTDPPLRIFAVPARPDSSGARQRRTPPISANSSPVIIAPLPTMQTTNCIGFEHRTDLLIAQPPLIRVPEYSEQDGIKDCVALLNAKMHFGSNGSA